MVRWGGRQWYVHRLAYHSLVSYLHKDVVVHHRCANRRCWRPEHLQATTAHANTAEMLSRRDLERTIRLTAQELHEVREDFLAVVEDAISLERERDLLIARLDRAHDIADALAAGNPASGPTQTPEGF